VTVDRPTDGWEIVVGLETHVQLRTASKMFCACATDYDGAEPNTRVCAVCLGLPGTLPAPNAAAVEFITRIALALDCRIASRTHFDRKNYHYPDLPKGYQISQYDEPFGVDGHLDVRAETGETFRVGVERVHLEEDTGKSSHGRGVSLVDYNRSGVPLVEIVTRPDMRSAEEAKAFLESLRQLVRWIGVSSGNMEAGALRADVNVSVRRRGDPALGTKVEVKNLNSFAGVKAAIEFERERLTARASAGETIAHETRGWSEADGRTVPQRTKEMADDYRYFPEPDLPPLSVAAEWVETVRAAMPELPFARRVRFETEFGLGLESARLLTRNAPTADYFEAAARGVDGDAQRLATFVTGPLFAHMKATGVAIDAVAARVPPANLAELDGLVASGGLSLTAARGVLDMMLAEGLAAPALVAREGLGGANSEAELDALIRRVLDENPGAVADYCGGKETAIAFLVGGVMRATRGQADPNAARERLRAALAARCEAA
jgi:aspartyl-tRNA(Asn)/glutamyl-tRNA(Gln) amidotransferase subunit B